MKLLDKIKEFFKEKASIEPDEETPLNLAKIGEYKKYKDAEDYIKDISERYKTSWKKQDKEW